MKTNNLILLIFIVLFTLSCEKETKCPENYDSYISLLVSNGMEIGFDNDSIIQIYIRNDSDKEFLKECLLDYYLYDSLTENYYYSKENICNYLIPDKPNGLLKLDKRGTIFQNKNLFKLKWSGEDFNNLKTGKYILEVQLFIKDPHSGANIIRSNRIIVSN